MYLVNVHICIRVCVLMQLNACAHRLVYVVCMCIVCICVDMSVCVHVHCVSVHLGGRHSLVRSLAGVAIRGAQPFEFYFQLEYKYTSHVDHVKHSFNFDCSV